MSDIKKSESNQNRTLVVVTPNVTISIQEHDIALPTGGSGDGGNFLSTSPRNRRFSAEPIMTNIDDSPK